MKKRSIYSIGISLFSFVSLIGIYLVTRLVNLTIIPIFTDEAIYLRWAQIALGDPRWRFISLLDGKQPLFIWLLLPLLKIIDDPLIAGRLLSVGMGAVSLTGFFAFSYYLSRNLKTAIIGGLFYVVIPFFLMYDRLAIYESLFMAIAIWSVFLSYLFGTKQRIDTALLLGSAIGVGLLTKSYANYYLLLLPVTLLLVPWKQSTWRMQFLKWVGLCFIVFIQSQIYSNILRLSEFRHIISQKNLSFIYSFSEFLANPLKSVYGNIFGLTNWLQGYLTAPLFIFIFVALFWNVKKNWKNGIFFAAYFFIPFGSLAFFGKVIYPRFLLFMLAPLLIPAILFYAFLIRKYKKVVLIGTIIIVALLIRFNYLILTNPISAPLPSADRQQFINDWPAGYGIPEVITYLEEQSKKGHIIVGTEGTFGLFPMALELYLGKNPNVTFKAFWPLNEFPQELLVDAQTQPTFLLFKERQQIPQDQNWPLELIKEYRRGDGPTFLKFYRVKTTK